MQRLSIDDMISNIRAEIPFEGVSEDYSFTCRVRKYANLVCAAIHDGHHFRSSLWNNCLFSEYERWNEEDPGTGQMVQASPILLVGRDSRFEYDLNRSPHECIYTKAWGKKLWKHPLSQNERDKSLRKHWNFYRVVEELIGKLEQKHGQALVIDMHSFNINRWKRKIPTWNLGTTNIDAARFSEAIASWQNKLQSVQLPYGIPSTVGINDTFGGHGYFLKYITENFRNTLVLATEIAKVYCDELTGVIFPEVINRIELQLSKLLIAQASEYNAQQV
jgi:hypothetical protein